MELDKLIDQFKNQTMQEMAEEETESEPESDVPETPEADRPISTPIPSEENDDPFWENARPVDSMVDIIDLSIDE